MTQNKSISKRDTKGWQRQRKKADEKENEFLNKRNDAKSSWSKKEQENVCRDEETNKKKRETVRKKGNKAEDEEEEKRSSFSIFFFDFSPSLLLFLSISFFTPSLSFFLYLSTLDERESEGITFEKGRYCSFPSCIMVWIRDWLLFPLFFPLFFPYSSSSFRGLGDCDVTFVRVLVFIFFWLLYWLWALLTFSLAS